MTAPSATRARLLVVALAGLCFAAGWLAGRTWPAVTPHSPTYLEQLTKAVDLRPDQVAAIEHLLADEDRDVDALLDRDVTGVRTEVAARRARTEQDMLALLDASQRQRYETLTAEASK